MHREDANATCVCASFMPRCVLYWAEEGQVASNIFQCFILFPSLDEPADQLNVLSTCCVCFDAEEKVLRTPAKKEEKVLRAPGKVSMVIGEIQASYAEVRFGKIMVELNSWLNKCGVIGP